MIVFGRGTVEDAVDALGGPGYTLLTTARAKDAAPGVVAAADRLVIVPGGHVDQIAADLLGEVSGDRLVALGGGRVVDVAKALAAALSAAPAAGARSPRRASPCARWRSRPPFPARR